MLSPHRFTDCHACERGKLGIFVTASRGDPCGRPLVQPKYLLPYSKFWQIQTQPQLSQLLSVAQDPGLL